MTRPTLLTISNITATISVVVAFASLSLAFWVHLENRELVNAQSQLKIFLSPEVVEDSGYAELRLYNRSGIPLVVSGSFGPRGESQKSEFDRLAGYLRESRKFALAVRLNATIADGTWLTIARVDHADFKQTLFGLLNASKLDFCSCDTLGRSCRAQQIFVDASLAGGMKSENSACKDT